MESKAIHQNLDTSFVNVAALIKYLRRRQFVGIVKIELNGYRADVELTKGDTLKVKEHDQISGRISEGEEALQRIFIRAREAGGTVNVFQTGASVKTPPLKNVAAHKKVAKKKIVKNPSNEELIKAKSVLTNGIPKPNTILSNPNGNTPQIKTRNPRLLVKKKAAIKKTPVPKKAVLPKRPKKVTPTPPPNTGHGLPDFPFDLSNKVEEKAKQALSSTEDWQSILNLMVELVRVSDRSLTMADINFGAAFKKVRSEIADDYPFLNPDLEEFEYLNGKILINKQMNPKVFVAGITESLHRIFEKLASHPIHKGTREETLKRINVLAKKRANVYKKFSITHHIEKIISS